MNAYPAFEEILIEAGEPVLVLLKKRTGKSMRYFFALSIPDKDFSVTHYFVASVQEKVAKVYFWGHCDLRFLFAHAPNRLLYCSEGLDIFSNRVKLIPFKGGVDENWLPSKHLFADAHTSDYGIQDGVLDEQVLYIDGEWQMPEFGDFYKKYSDLYLYFYGVSEVENTQTSDVMKKKISAAIVSKPYQGGSSYLAMFKDLYSSMPVDRRPGLESIEYASPGEMEIRGQREIFETLHKVYDNYLGAHVEIKARHDYLRGLLTKNKLLSAPAKAISNVNDDALEEIIAAAKRLDAEMKLDAWDVLLRLSSRNVLVASKILLALFRRLSVSGNFFAQGRVAYKT